MIKRHILAALLVINVANLNAQKTAPVQPKVNRFTLAQALDYAKQNAVQVKNALIDIKIQQQINRDVTSNALPSINANASVTKNFDIPIQKIPNFIAPATYQVLIDEGVKDGNGLPVTMPSASDLGFLNLPFGNPWNAVGGVTLNQILFDGQVFIALKARNSTITLQEKIAELTEENIRHNVMKVYYQLLVSKYQIQLLDANLDRLRKLQRDVQLIYDNGLAERLDIDKLTVQLSNLETERLKADFSVNNGNAGLKVLLGMPYRDSLILTDTLSEDQIKEGVLEASQYNYADRKDYQVAELASKLNEYNVSRFKLAKIPTLSLTAGYSKQAQRTEFNFFQGGEWFTASYLGLNLRIPIFNGFSLQAKTEKARLELQKSRNDTEALKISIDSEVDNAKNNFVSAISTMDYQKRNMVLAEKVYEQTKKKYEVGTGSSTEINTAQVELKTAQTNYIVALYQATVAKVDFLKATGKL